MTRDAGTLLSYRLLGYLHQDLLSLTQHVADQLPLDTLAVPGRGVAFPSGAGPTPPSAEAAFIVSTLHRKGGYISVIPKHSPLQGNNPGWL